MAQSEAAGISSSQLHPLPTSSPQQPLPVDAHDPAQPLTMQENQATVHDFLSLCGTAVGRSSSAAAAPDHGSQQWSTTQDFLQPLQKSLIPSGSASNSLRPNEYTLCQSQPYIGSSEPGVGQQSCYGFSNGNFEPKENFASKFRSANISFGSRGNVAHSLHLAKHWQQQAAVEVFDGNKRLSKVPSEEEDDDDDESFEHIYSVKKEGGNQKGESSQPMEGRNLDKGVTPRSKHSATEQRRRSKINDRFQMLRQLLPNADQKRDKASFLLEVIEYIQMLHEKVKKYEGFDFRGQNQERTKILSWDRASGPQDVIANLAQDMKDVPDANGFVRSRLSPLTAISEDAITSSGLMCSVVQSSALQSALNFDSKPIICKSMPLNFSQTTPTSKPEQAINHMHQISIQDNQTFFSQLLRQEDQATSKVRDLFSQKTDALQPHIQQSQNTIIPQDSHQLEDRGFPCVQNIDHEHVSALNISRPEKEPEGQDRAGQVTDFGFCSGKGFIKPSVGLDGRGLPVCSQGSRMEQSTEVMPAKEQEAPTILGGVINISSTYSQGLLDTLTRALQSSGVDMAQATISVQIDLGKAELSSSKQTVPLPIGVSPLQNNQMLSANVSETPNKRMKLEAD